MLRNAADLKGFAIQATDGEIGSVRDIYFDDETWAIRYLTVDTGGWLEGRVVLISPIMIRQADWDTKRLEAALTQDQLKKSPDINTHQPVSRQHESEYFAYYGYPVYWGGPYMWGSSFFPVGLPAPTPAPSEASSTTGDSSDSHLRSAEEVNGYGIEATDGEIGHLAGFVMDDETWAIRYIEASTRNWWPGKKVLVSPAWIARVSWVDSSVYVDLARETIKGAPEYSESMVVAREYEQQLFSHYGRPPYWPQGTVHARE
jgi:hypothetical protein